MTNPLFPVVDPICGRTNDPPDLCETRSLWFPVFAQLERYILADLKKIACDEKSGTTMRRCE